MLKPHISFIVLEYTGSDSARAIPTMMAFLRRKAIRRTGARLYELVDDGFAVFEELPLEDSPDGLPDLNGFTYRKVSSPSWATKDSGYLDDTHKLALVYRHRTLVAIHAEDRLRSAILKWVRGPDCPPFRVIPRAILNAAFLAGEAKGMWLGGVHPHSPNKASAKHLSGPRLQDALNPADDSTFALNAARASLQENERRPHLAGTAGATPSDSFVWLWPSHDLTDFLLTTRDVLDLLHETMGIGTGVTQPFPELAITLDTLHGVLGAFEFTITHPEDLLPGTGEDTIEAAQELHNSLIDIRGDATGANFTLLIGRNGAVAGELRCGVSMQGQGVRLEVGFPTTPTHDQLVRPVRDALSTHSELLTIYYSSGHVITNGQLAHRQTRPAAFHQWEFSDFTDYDILTEKPASSRSPAAIHAGIAQPGDNSLFSWAVQQFSSGWLTCDDSSGEVADFVQLLDDGLLRVIHIKVAKSDSHRRGVALGAFDVVVTQAVKNARFLYDLDELVKRLGGPAVPNPATWHNGHRIDDRTEMIELLRCRTPQDRTEVVIVQPHITDALLAGLREQPASEPSGPNHLRLQLLETVLNTARSAIVGLSADLAVIGSKASNGS